MDLDCGFIGQFDMDNETDNLGYDGIYGLQFVGAVRENLFLRLRTYHTSSHLGDEYIDTTGRERIAYTREEIRLGAAWRFDPDWLAYTEAGYAVLPRTHDVVTPWALQGGVQYVRKPCWLDDQLGWYTALDVSAFEENDWDANVTMQTGLHIPISGRRRLYRLGLEYYDGRVRVGELSTQAERRIAVGAWVDI